MLRQRARQRLIDQLLDLLKRQPGLRVNLWFDGDTLHDYTPAPICLCITRGEQAPTGPTSTSWPICGI